MKRLITLLLCLAMALSLAACSGWRHDVAGPGVELRLGHTLDEDDPLHESMLAWAEAVDEVSEGSLRISIAPEGELGTEADYLGLLQSGELDMALLSFETLRALHSEWNAVSTPYIFDHQQHFYDVMDGEIGEDLYALTEAEGFVGLTWLESGARAFYTAAKPVEKPGDLRGLRIAAVSDEAAALIAALGGVPVPMQDSEVPAALQSGAIDGAENFLAALEDGADGVRYVSSDNHVRTPSVLVISTDAWNRLSEQQREILKGRSEELSGIRRAAWSDHEASIRADLREDDVKFPAAAEAKVFRRVCQSLYDALQQDDPAAYAFAERILAAADEK